MAVRSWGDQAPNLPHTYPWDRFLRTLVLEGFGSYCEAAEANIVDAAIFLILRDTVEDRINKWLTSRSK